MPLLPPELAISPSNVELLRTIGFLLGSESVTELTVAQDTQLLTVSWRTDGDRRKVHYLPPPSLAILQQRARAARHTFGELVDELGPRAYLRTLGQLLDDARITFALVSQEPQGYRVLGRSAGRFARAWYPTDHLDQESRQRQALRSPTR
jgi:hypothetical protein